MKKLLWLDDNRDPSTHQRFMVPYILLDQEYEIVWVKNYNEFKQAVDSQVFDQVSFDHDLADEHYDPDIKPEDYKEKTGLDCLEYFLKHCYSKNDKVKLTFHTMNDKGFKNMVNCYKDFLVPKITQDNR